MSTAGRRPLTQSISSAERDERTLEILGSSGRVEVGGLADLFAVSEMTVRRDLDRLAGRGRLRRVRGGAVAIGPEPFAERYARQAAEKDVIADKLVDLVGAGGAVAMDASTTIQRLVRRLRDVGHLTVLTNGPDTFFALQDVEGVTAVLTGGQLDKRTGSLVGPVAARATRTLTLRRAFVSATAIEPELGTTEQTLEDAEAKASLVDAAASLVVAVDHTKLGHHATARCLDTARIDVLVTDLDPADARLDDYRDRCELL